MGYFERLYYKQIEPPQYRGLITIEVKYPSGTSPRNAFIDIRTNDETYPPEAEELLEALREAVAVLAQAQGTGNRIKIIDYNTGMERDYERR